MSKKSMVSFGGALTVAGLLALAAPRAAHAVAAALVQVTNTAASPAITEDVSHQAAQIVEIACGGFPAPGLSPCGPVFTNGATGLGYTTPATGALVITSVDVIAVESPCTANSQTLVGLFAGNSQRRTWTVQGLATAHYSYPSGFVLPPSTTLNFQNNGSCLAAIDMNGYITPN